MPCHTGDPVCQNGRRCYGGVCDCGPLYNGTTCDNGASQFIVTWNFTRLFCGVLVLYAHLVPHLLPHPSPSPSPLPPQLLVNHVAPSTASMVGAVLLEVVNVWTPTLGITASTGTVSWARPSTTAVCMCVDVTVCTVRMCPCFPRWFSLLEWRHMCVWRILCLLCMWQWVHWLHLWHQWVVCARYILWGWSCSSCWRRTVWCVGGWVCAYICIFDVLQDLKCVEMSFARTMGHVWMVHVPAVLSTQEGTAPLRFVSALYKQIHLCQWAV